MIKYAILAIAAVAVSVMFLPQTLATLPELGVVVDVFADTEEVTDGVLGNIAGSLLDAIGDDIGEIKAKIIDPIIDAATGVES